jgi:hypothetical protein
MCSEGRQLPGRFDLRQGSGGQVASRPTKGHREGFVTTFSIAQTSQVSLVTGAIDTGVAQEFPLFVRGHHQVRVTVAFFSESGGFVDIQMTDKPVHRIEQVPGMNVRTRVYCT